MSAEQPRTPTVLVTDSEGGNEPFPHFDEVPRGDVFILKDVTPEGASELTSHFEMTLYGPKSDVSNHNVSMSDIPNIVDLLFRSYSLCARTVEGDDGKFAFLHLGAGTFQGHDPVEGRSRIKNNIATHLGDSVAYFCGKQLTVTDGPPPEDSGYVKRAVVEFKESNGLTTATATATEPLSGGTAGAGSADTVTYSYQPDKRWLEPVNSQKDILEKGLETFLEQGRFNGSMDGAVVPSASVSDYAAVTGVITDPRVWSWCWTAAQKVVNARRAGSDIKWEEVEE